MSKGLFVYLQNCLQIDKDSVRRVSETKVPDVEGPVACFAFSGDDTRLLLACNNGIIVMHSHASSYVARCVFEIMHLPIRTHTQHPNNTFHQQIRSKQRLGENPTKCERFGNRAQQRGPSPPIQVEMWTPQRPYVLQKEVTPWNF